MSVAIVGTEPGSRARATPRPSARELRPEGAGHARAHIQTIFLSPTTRRRGSRGARGGRSRSEAGTIHFSARRFAHVADRVMTAEEAEDASRRARRWPTPASAGFGSDVVLSRASVPEPSAYPTGRRRRASIAPPTRDLEVDPDCASSIRAARGGPRLPRGRAAKVVLLVQSHILLRAITMEHPASPGLGGRRQSPGALTRAPGSPSSRISRATHGE